MSRWSVRVSNDTVPVVFDETRLLPLSFAPRAGATVNGTNGSSPSLQICPRSRTALAAELQKPGGERDSGRCALVRPSRGSVCGTCETRLQRWNVGGPRRGCFRAVRMRLSRRTLFAPSQPAGLRNRLLSSSEGTHPPVTSLAYQVSGDRVAAGRVSIAITIRDPDARPQAREQLLEIIQSLYATSSARPVWIGTVHSGGPTFSIPSESLCGLVCFNL